MKMFKIIFTVITFIVLTIQSIVMHVTTGKIYEKLYDKIYDLTGDYVKSAIIAFMVGGVVITPVCALIGVFNGVMLGKFYKHFSA